MNKKFFSAVLMGALLLGGTFVSCQDYDDDIDNLQEQINKLASADQLSSKVSELQSAISAAQSAAEAKAAAANTVAEAAKKAAGDADAKAAAAQKAADDVKAAAGNYATKEEATAAANAAQKVANDLAAALEGALTEADVNAAIDTALKAALDKYATTEALQAVADELAKIQEAIAKCASEDDLKALADKVAAIETAGVPGVAAAVASVAVPAPAVSATRTWAIWDASKHATGASATRFAALKAEFAKEIALLDEDGKPHDQGGYLPVVVNPSNVDLSEGYTFALQSVDGKVAEIEVAEVVKGLPAGSTLANGLLTTKAAAEDNLWSVKVVPAKNKYNQYENVNENTALVIEDGEGVAYKTAFAYTYASAQAKDVTIASKDTAYLVNGEVDVFASVNGKTPVFTLKDEANGIFILSVEDKADKARYGISDPEGSVISFSKFPSNKNSIEIRDVKLIALGLNGSTKESTIKYLTVIKSTSEITPLSDQPIALDYKNLNEVRWAVKELDMDAAGEEDVWKAIKDTVTEVSVTVLKDGNVFKTYKNLKAYRNNGLESSSYKNFDQFGFDFAGVDLPPYEYTVQVKVGNLFLGKGTLTTSYPTGLINLYKALCVEDKDSKELILQMVGDPVKTAFDEGVVKYNMNSGLQTAAGVVVKKIIDLDEDPDWDKTDSVTVTGPKNQVGSKFVHNFSAIYSVNGGEDMEFTFKAALVSPIYAEGGKNSITVKGGEAYFNSSKAANKKITLTSTVEREAKIVAGYDRNKTYKLFTKKGAEAGEGTAMTPEDHSSPKIFVAKNTNYVLNAAGKDFVEVTENVYLNTFFGTSYDKNHPHYLTEKEWTDGAEHVKEFFTRDEETGVYKNKKSIYVLVRQYMEDGVAKDSIITDFNQTGGWGEGFYEAINDSTFRAYHLARTNGINHDTYASSYDKTKAEMDTLYSKRGAVNPKDSAIVWKLVDKATCGYESVAADAGQKLIFDFYNDYRDKIAFNTYDYTKPGAAAGQDDPYSSNYLAAEPYFIFEDEEVALKYLKPEYVDTTSKHLKSVTTIDDMKDDVPGGSVTVNVIMVVKDWWGQTMKVQIPLTLYTKEK